MSVDKFGRYSEIGVNYNFNRNEGGLPLTADGDYDIGNKRLKFVKKPKDNNDAINLKTLKDETSSTLKLERDVYNANFHRITNVGEPITETDSVSKQYLLKELSNSLQFNGESFDAKNKKIINVARSVDKHNVIIKEELDEKLKEPLKLTQSIQPRKAAKGTNNDDTLQILDNRRISGLSKGVYPYDAVVKAQLDEVDNKIIDSLKQEMIKYDINKDNWDAKGKKISNVKEGDLSEDVVIKSQLDDLKNNCLSKDVINISDSFISMKKRRIVRVAKSIDKNDVVIKEELEDLISRIEELENRPNLKDFPNLLFAAPDTFTGFRRNAGDEYSHKNHVFRKEVNGKKVLVNYQGNKFSCPFDNSEYMITDANE